MQHLRKLAYPIALLYAAGVGVRNCLFRYGVLKSNAFSTPVVSVGNISVGGTGKTPMIEWILNSLGEVRRLAVVSRGYKRTSKGMIIASAESTPQSIGDEPLQLLNKFPEIPIIVDKNRTRAIQYLEKNLNPDLILLDDGHQHRRVNPRLAIVLTPYYDLYTENRWLPVGNLRDSVSAAERAQVIIVTKCPPSLSREQRKGISSRLKPGSDQKVLFSTLTYGKRMMGTGSPVAVEALGRKPFTLVTGIANPEPLVRYLEQQGLQFNHMRFRDHHYFTENDLVEIAKKDTVVTTTKDYVRLRDNIPNLYYLEVGHEFLGEDGEVLKAMLLAL